MYSAQRGRLVFDSLDEFYHCFDHFRLRRQVWDVKDLGLMRPPGKHFGLHVATIVLQSAGELLRHLA